MKYSPHDLLPAPEPSTIRPHEYEFYDDVAKHLIPDFVRIMSNGIPINLEKVRELEAEIDTVLARVTATLNSNPLIQQFQQERFDYLCQDYVEEMQSKLKKPQDFIKPYDNSKMLHRSYLMTYLNSYYQLGIKPPDDILCSDGGAIPIHKWSIKDIKPYVNYHPTISLIYSKAITSGNSNALAAMEMLAADKCEIHNRPYLQKINELKVPLPDFNPGSSKQKQLLFGMLGIESEKVSKDTGEPSWSRDEIERVNKETTDPAVKELTQTLIDYSFGAIIKQNFIPAFYRCTVDGRLYGTLRLFGAKTFRPTSQDPFN